MVEKNILEYIGNWDWMRAITNGRRYSVKYNSGDAGYIHYVEGSKIYVLLMGSNYFIAKNCGTFACHMDVLLVLGNFCVICWSEAGRFFTNCPGTLVGFDVL